MVILKNFSVERLSLCTYGLLIAPGLWTFVLMIIENRILPLG